MKSGFNKQVSARRKFVPREVETTPSKFEGRKVCAELFGAIVVSDLSFEELWEIDEDRVVAWK